MSENLPLLASPNQMDPVRPSAPSTPAGPSTPVSLDFPAARVPAARSGMPSPPPTAADAPWGTPGKGFGRAMGAAAVVAAALTAGTAGRIAHARTPSGLATGQAGARTHADERALPPNAAGAEAVGEGGEGADSTLVNMAPFVVNLDEDPDEMHYLKVQVAVQLAAPSFSKGFESKTPKIRNALVFYLSALKFADIRGLEAKKKVLERVRNEVREAAGQAAIADVFLTEFVVQ